MTQTWFSHQFSPVEFLGLVGLVGGLLIALAGIVAGSVHTLATARIEAALKHEMLARGMSPDEIARVVDASADPSGRGVIDLPCASEAVVEGDGEWHAALVLQVADGRYHIHYVGTEMDENEWVGPERIRFPAGSSVPDLVARLRTDRNGAQGPGKGPVEAEV